jgi:hypothetical protein
VIALVEVRLCRLLDRMCWFELGGRSISVRRVHPLLIVENRDVVKEPNPVEIARAFALAVDVSFHFDYGKEAGHRR